jgi:hypothetical protein
MSEYSAEFSPFSAVVYDDYLRDLRCGQELNFYFGGGDKFINTTLSTKIVDIYVPDVSKYIFDVYGGFKDRKLRIWGALACDPVYDKHLVANLQALQEWCNPNNPSSVKLLDEIPLNKIYGLQTDRVIATGNRFLIENIYNPGTSEEQHVFRATRPFIDLTVKNPRECR